MAFNEKLRLIIDADAKGALKEIEGVGKTAERELGRAEQKARNWSATFTRAGSMMVTGAAIAAVGLYKLGQSASELEQQVGGTSAVFGESSAEIDRWAKTAARGAGLSEAAARQATSQIGALLQGMGMSSREAATEAKNLTQLGADLAATFGGSVNEAITAVSAALRGERDPIERYGVSFKQTDVAARAAAMGLDTSTAAAEKNANRIATLDILYAQTSNAQGQFGREAGTAAGQQAVLNAELENAKAAIGEGVLPIMTALTGAVGDAVGSFNALSPAVKTGVGSVAAWATVVTGAAGGMALIAGRAIELKRRYDELSISQQKLTKGAAAAGAAIGVAYAMSELASAVRDAHGPTAKYADAVSKLSQDLKSSGQATKAFQERVDAANASALDIDTSLTGVAGSIASLPFRVAQQGVEGWTDATKTNREEFKKTANESLVNAQLIIDGLKRQGTSTKEYEKILSDTAVAQTTANQQTDVAAAKVDAYQKALASGKSTTEASTAAIDAETAAKDKNAASDDELKKKIEARMSAQIAAVNSVYADAQANRALREASLQYLEVQGEVNSGTVAGIEAAGKLDEAENKLLGQILAVAASSQRLAEDQAKANGITDTATLGAVAFRDKLIELKKQFPELAVQLDGYIGRLNDIPAEVRSVVFLDTEDAATKISNLESKWSGMRALFGAPVPGGTFLANAAGRASGGPVSAGGSYWVGERGPEPFIPTGGGRVISTDRANNYTVDRAGTSVTINTVTSSTAEQIVQELTWASRAGKY